MSENLSFSSNVKNELIHRFGNESYINVAEITAMLNLCGQVCKINDRFCVKIQTDNVSVARKYFTLLKKTFNIDNKVDIKENKKFHRTRSYSLVADDKEIVRSLLLETEMTDIFGNINIPHIPKKINEELSYKRAYIRGAFLVGGCITNPERAYHLEFVTGVYSYALQLMDLINSFGIDSKVVKRKDNFVIYIKESEQIVDLLNIMEATVSLMDLENVRILKGMRNNVNRLVNCETANINKTIAAAVKQIDDIEYIQNTVGLTYLPNSLEEMAKIRIENPDLSLKELGLKLSPPVGKSGVNHRLKKICEIANLLREEKGRTN